VGAGRLESIHTAPEGAAPTVVGHEAVLEAGRGVVGDRYYLKNSSARRKGGRDGPHREVTLIEAEAVEAAAREYGIEFGPGAARRNLVTRGVPLNHLVGREFSVGTVRLRGILLCEPCLHMERLAGKPGIRKSLVHRGGLNAEILSSGTVRPGDAVVWQD